MFNFYSEMFIYLFNYLLLRKIVGNQLLHSADGVSSKLSRSVNKICISDFFYTHINRINSEFRTHVSSNNVHLMIFTHFREYHIL